MNRPAGSLPRADCRFGMFMRPFHATNLDPTYALERDLQLLTLLDRLGFDEAWIGEHHSGGFEIIASPEVFIAAAAFPSGSFRIHSERGSKETAISGLAMTHPGQP